MCERCFFMSARSVCAWWLWGFDKSLLCLLQWLPCFEFLGLLCELLCAVTHGFDLQFLWRKCLGLFINDGFIRQLRQWHDIFYTVGLGKHGFGRHEGVSGDGGSCSGCGVAWDDTNDCDESVQWVRNLADLHACIYRVHEVWTLR